MTGCDPKPIPSESIPPVPSAPTISNTDDNSKPSEPKEVAHEARFGDSSTLTQTGMKHAFG